MTREFNPIDKDKITESPGTLAYPHHVGSVAIKPEDVGKIKGRALAAMEQQTNKQLSQLKQQMQLIADQANEIKRRIEISQQIYGAQIGFEPLVGHNYFLYQKATGEFFLSMLSPDEWGRKKPFEAFISEVTLLADHTWDLV